MASITPTQLAYSAANLIGIVDENNPNLTSTQIANILTAANYLIDAWAVQSLSIPVQTREVFTLATAQQAVTIGAAGNWITVRPQSIDGISVVQNPTTAQSITSITRTGNVATATKVAHGYVSGMSIMIGGAAQTAYNGTAVITVTSSSVFTFPVAGAPTTPATGTLTAQNTIGGITTEELYLGQWTYSGEIAQLAKGQTNQWPTRFYYQPNYVQGLGLGHITFWPITTQSNTMVVYASRQLAEVDLSALSTSVAMPSGYTRALKFNIAVEIAPNYGVDLSQYPTVVKTATDSFNDVKRSNDKLEVLSTGDAGAIFGRSWWNQADGFNIYTGP